jgi:3-oxoacyl-[acyl-carrier protein] reductase
MNTGAIVTGGSSGIGWATIQRLVNAGHDVTNLDRSPPPDRSLARFIEVDLADPRATAAALDEVLARHPVTRLVNNVGRVIPASLDETTLEDFDAQMALNVRCALQCTKAVVPAMKAARFGRIVNISSRAALGKELRTAYAAGKAALHGFTRTWALELARYGITVNAVGPGPIDTPIFRAANPADSPRTKAIIDAIPVRRMGTPADIAHAVAFFLEEASGFITGQVLYACGGMTVGAGR